MYTLSCTETLFSHRLYVLDKRIHLLLRIISLLKCAMTMRANVWQQVVRRHPSFASECVTIYCRHSGTFYSGFMETLHTKSFSADIFAKKFKSSLINAILVNCVVSEVDHFIPTILQ